MQADANDDPRETLTERERQCLRLVFERLRPKEIGRELGISHHTVNGHLQQAMRKLGATSSIEAARLVHAAERLATPEKITGYPLGVEFSPVSSSLSSSQPEEVTPNRSNQWRLASARGNPCASNPTARSRMSARIA